MNATQIKSLSMYDKIIKLLLIFLIVFTPIAFGSMELWAFSVMELSILLVIILAAAQTFTLNVPKRSNLPNNPNGHTHLHIHALTILLCLFLLFILFQIISLPSGLIKIISPKTDALRQSLSISNFEPSALNFESSTSTFPLSFFPFLTQIEFFKWLTLSGLFIFFLRWKPLEQGDRTKKQLILVVMAVGVLESLYGIFEFFSGHHHILYLIGPDSVAGTFINRNYFAGYLLMVIPLSVGFLFSREVVQDIRYGSWRERLSSLDGKTVLIGFGVIVMILGLLFSASRMGIVSLLLSLSLISFLFRSPEKEKRFSKTAVLIFGLALLWAAWIGLDAVTSRFFSVSESFEDRWKIWVNTFQIFKDFPLFGSGLGTFIQVFPMYRSFHILGLVTHSENDFLQLLSETGILGTGLLAALFFYLLFKAFSGIRALSRRSRRKPARYIGLGGLVGILALMFHSLVERNIQVPANAFLYTVLWAVVLNGSRRDSKSLSN
jgi:hypothetical protein